MQNQNVIELPHIKLSNQELNEMKMMLDANQRLLMHSALETYNQIIAKNFIALQHKKPTKVARSVPVYGKNDLLNSALFKRLLSQQDPLDHPPPTNMGNPWYALIDSHAPQPVMLTFGVGVASAMTQLTLHGENIDDVRFVSLNRHAWQIAEANDAGNELLKFIDEDNDHLSQTELAKRVTSLLVAEPSIVLTDANFGLFELYRGEHTHEYATATLDEFNHWYGRLKHGVNDFTYPAHIKTDDNGALTNIELTLTSWLIKKL